MAYSDDLKTERKESGKSGVQTAEKQKPSHRLGSLNSGAGLGIISTTNTLFVIGFIDISRKQRPH
ncbi:hypothetical protein MXL54_07320 [Enterobacteriaceae bacterium G50]|nr:hypothetical protein [Enterobacteriaceae bacterium G50]